MKIKKIDFQHDKGESYDIYYAVLPVGHDARVELTLESKDTVDGNECWSWEIDTERYTGKCGVAKTKELAMEACQAAWEKMVMAALEPNTGCKFCTGNTSTFPLKHLSAHINQYSKKLYLDIPDDGDDEFKEDYIDMDYCLVCGMKL